VASDALIPTLEEALETVRQALPGLGLTQFQQDYIVGLMVYEQMQLDEGWVSEWIIDLAREKSGRRNNPWSP
jgi:hypothetical protein